MFGKHASINWFLRVRATGFLEEKEIKTEKEKDIYSLMQKYKDIDQDLLRKALGEEET